MIDIEYDHNEILNLVHKHQTDSGASLALVWRSFVADVIEDSPMTESETRDAMPDNFSIRVFLNRLIQLENDGLLQLVAGEERLTYKEPCITRVFTHAILTAAGEAARNDGPEYYWLDSLHESCQ